MIDLSLIFNILIAFGAFQALFLSVIFLTQKNRSSVKKFFALFLIIEGITLIERLVAETNLMVAVPHLLGVSYPISFIKPPILFFMALTIVDATFKLRKIHFLHAIPLLIMLLLNVPFYFQSAEFKIEMVAAFIKYVPKYDSFNFWLFFSFYLNIGAYITVAISTLRKHQVHVKNNKLANWYLWVLKLYSTTLLIGFIYFVIRPSELIDLPMINTISMLTMTFLIQSIAYSFLSQTNIFKQNGTRFLSNVDQLIKDESLIKSKLENEKVYRDDTLNLDDFSKSLELSKKYVSDLINQRFGNSFKEVINHYRVEEAKRLMLDGIDSKAHLTSIGYESGFNNKVSFYRVFKRHTGKSPSQYFQSLKNRRLPKKVPSNQE